MGDRSSHRLHTFRPTVSVSVRAPAFRNPSDCQRRGDHLRVQDGLLTASRIVDGSSAIRAT
jgi:hypothetical protein